MKPDALLWHNNSKKSLAQAITEASAAHVRRLGAAPTHVILPVGGEYPAEVGGLKVVTDLKVKGLFMQVYADGVDGEK